MVVMVVVQAAKVQASMAVVLEDEQISEGEAHLMWALCLGLGVGVGVGVPSGSGVGVASSEQLSPSPNTKVSISDSPAQSEMASVKHADSSPS